MKRLMLVLLLCSGCCFFLLRLPTGAKLAEAPFHSPAARNDIAQMKLLLDKGLDVNARDDRGYTAIFIALGHGNVEMADFLLSRGARLELADNEGNGLAKYIQRTGPENSIKWLTKKGYK